MGARGPKKDSQMIKANRGSDHVDTELLERERTLASLGSPFDLLELYDDPRIPPLMVAFVDEFLIPAAQLGYLHLSDTVSLKMMIDQYVLMVESQERLDEVKKEYIRLNKIFLSKEWFAAQKALHNEEKSFHKHQDKFLQLLGKFGLTPGDRGNITGGEVQQSQHGNAKQSKKDKYG